MHLIEKTSTTANMRASYFQQEALMGHHFLLLCWPNDAFRGRLSVSGFLSSDAKDSSLLMPSPNVLPCSSKIVAASCCLRPPSLLGANYVISISPPNL